MRANETFTGRPRFSGQASQRYQLLCPVLPFHCHCYCCCCCCWPKRNETKASCPDQKQSSAGDATQRSAAHKRRQAPTDVFARHLLLLLVSLSSCPCACARSNQAESRCIHSSNSLVVCVVHQIKNARLIIKAHDYNEASSSSTRVGN